MRLLRHTEVPIAQDDLSFLKDEYHFGNVPPDPLPPLFSDRPDIHYAVDRALRGPAVAGTVLGFEESKRLEALKGKIQSEAARKRRASIASLLSDQAPHTPTLGETRKIRDLDHAASTARMPGAAAHPIFALALYSQINEIREASALGDSKALEDARDRLMLTAGVAAGFDMLMGVDELAAQVRTVPTRLLSGEANLAKNVAKSVARRPATSLATLLAAGVFGNMI